MSRFDLAREPVSRLRVRTRAVVLVVDEVTGRPPPLPPSMRVQRLLDPGAEDLGWRATRTAGGAVVFDGLMDVDGAGAIEHYRLVVEADATHRPDRPAGYAFTVGPNPARWPVRLVVRLLPGPAYAFPPRLPVVRGRVVELAAERPPVANAVVAAFADGATQPEARCGTDDRGSFSLGIPSYHPSRSVSIQARAPGFQPGARRRVVPRDFERSVRLTVRR